MQRRCACAAMLAEVRMRDISAADLTQRNLSQQEPGQRLIRTADAVGRHMRGDLAPAQSSAVRPSNSLPRQHVQAQHYLYLS
jgi:hypothetical protein